MGVPVRVERPALGDLEVALAKVPWAAVTITRVPPGWTLDVLGPDPETGGTQALLHRIVTDMGNMLVVVPWSNGQSTAEQPIYYRHTEGSWEVERLEGDLARSSRPWVEDHPRQ